MTIRSVGNRIAVNFTTLNLPISKEEALEILERKNIKETKVDINLLALHLVGNAKWKLPSRQWEAPHFFDCSSLIKWIYGQKGIWIPRRPLQQFEFCQEYGSLVGLTEIKPGDILFLSSPYKQGVRTDQGEKIGHVCIVAKGDDAVCATDSELGVGVIKLPVSAFLLTRKLAGIGRVVNNEADITTLIFPPEREIETVDDVRWIVLQSL